MAGVLHEIHSIIFLLWFSGLVNKEQGAGVFAGGMECTISVGSMSAGKERDFIFPSSPDPPSGSHPPLPQSRSIVRQHLPNLCMLHLGTNPRLIIASVSGDIRKHMSKRHHCLARPSQLNLELDSQSSPLTTPISIPQNVKERSPLFKAVASSDPNTIKNERFQNRALPRPERDVPTIDPKIPESESRKPSQTA